MNTLSVRAAVYAVSRRAGRHGVAHECQPFWGQRHSLPFTHITGPTPRARIHTKGSTLLKERSLMQVILYRADGHQRSIMAGTVTVAYLLLLISVLKETYEARNKLRMGHGAVDAYVRNALIVHRPVNAFNRDALLQQFERILGFYRPVSAVEAFDRNIKAVRETDLIARSDPEVNALLVAAFQTILVFSIDIYRQQDRPIDVQTVKRDVFASLRTLLKVMNQALLPVLDKARQKLLVDDNVGAEPAYTPVDRH
ncbi:hypothetical protein EV122DRAFT_292073 [Schizophyllum commune]